MLIHILRRSYSNFKFRKAYHVAAVLALVSAGWTQFATSRAGWGIGGGSVIDFSYTTDGTLYTVGPANPDSGGSSIVRRKPTGPFFQDVVGMGTISVDSIAVAGDGSVTAMTGGYDTPVIEFYNRYGDVLFEKYWGGRRVKIDKTSRYAAWYDSGATIFKVRPDKVEQLYNVRNPENINVVDFSPDGFTFAVANNKGQVYVLQTKDGSILRNYQLAIPNLTGLSISPDGIKMLAWSDYKPIAQIINFNSGSIIRQLLLPVGSISDATWVSSDEFVLASEEGAIVRANMDGRLIGSWTVPGDVQKVEATNDGRVGISAFERKEGFFSFFELDINSGEPPSEPIPGAWVAARSNRYMATIGREAVDVRDLRTGSLISSMKLPEGEHVVDAIWLTDETRLVMSSQTRMLVVDPFKKLVITSLPYNVDMWHKLSLTSDGSLLLIPSKDLTVLRASDLTVYNVLPGNGEQALAIGQRWAVRNGGYGLLVSDLSDGSTLREFSLGLYPKFFAADAVTGVIGVGTQEVVKTYDAWSGVQLTSRPLKYVWGLSLLESGAIAVVINSAVMINSIVIVYNPVSNENLYSLETKNRNVHKVLSGFHPSDLTFLLHDGLLEMAHAER